MVSLFDFIIFLSLFFNLGIIILGLIKYRIFNLPLKALFYLLIASLISDTISYIFASQDIGNELYINIYTLIEGFLFMLFYKYLNEKWAIPIGALIFFSIAIIEWIAFTQISSFIDFASVIESCLLIIFALRFFGRMLGELNVGRLTEYPIFWINCAVLIYFAGSMFLFAFKGLIMQQGLAFLWILHNFIHLIFLLLISIAFWKVRSTQI